MVLATYGVDLDQNLVRESVFGSYISRYVWQPSPKNKALTAMKLLNENGISASYTHRATIDSLIAATELGHPVIARKNGHTFVIDRVYRDGNKVLVDYRDPLRKNNDPLYLKEAKVGKGEPWGSTDNPTGQFTGEAIATRPDFEFVSNSNNAWYDQKALAGEIDGFGGGGFGEINNNYRNHFDRPGDKSIKPPHPHETGFEGSGYRILDGSEAPPAGTTSTPSSESPAAPTSSAADSAFDESSALLTWLLRGSEESGADPFMNIEVNHASLTLFAEVAVYWWSEIASELPEVSISVSWQDLEGAELGYSQFTDFSDGLPTAGIVVLDRDAAGFGWYLDADPWSDDEFSAPGLTAASGSGPHGRYDLLTVMAHEIGHLLGFTDDVPGFADHLVTDSSGSVFFGYKGQRVALTGDGDHLHSSFFSDKLMSATLGLGTRKRPGTLEAGMLQSAWEKASWSLGTPRYSINYLHTVDHLDPHSRFVLFSDSIVDDLHNGPPSGVQDGGFDQGGAPDWNQFGSVDVSTGEAVLAEGDLLFSDVSQVFKIPVGAESISFSISGLSLNANDRNPPDAFEVALLDAVGISPLAHVPGLSHTDALLNIQADGTVFLADGVTITGDVSSDSFDVTISLAVAQAGDPVALFFDLIRFGDAESTVTIDGVTINAAATTDPEAPVVDAGTGTARIDEGSRLSRPGSFSDANGADTYTATVDYGDGGGVQTLGLGGTGFLLDHLYAQNGTYLVTVNVTDGSDLVGTDTILVTVDNVAPTVEVGGDRSVAFGTPVAVGGSFGDPGLADTHTASIDWGDGTVESVTVDQVNDTLSAGHNYGALGDYTVTVIVTDGDGGIGQDSFLVSVLLTAPAVNVFGPTTVNEGVSYRVQLVASGASAALITGWVIDWGDGSTPETIAGQPLEAFHAFASGPALFTVTATALIGTTEYAAAPLTVRVLNVAPALGGLTHETVIDEGGTVTVVGTFTDGGSTDTHTLLVDWGDGTVETVAIPLGDRAFTLTHQYLDNRPGDAPIPVLLTISDDDGGESGRDFDITVRNLAPTGSIVFPTSAVRGIPQGFSSVVSDPSTTDDIEISWDFGDGTVLPFRSVNDPDARDPRHTFSTSGIYSVTMILRDSDGAVGITTGDLSVRTVPSGGGGGSPTGVPGMDGIGGTAGGADLASVDPGTLPAVDQLISTFLETADRTDARNLPGTGSGLSIDTSIQLGTLAWLSWQSLYDRAVEEALAMEFLIAETLRVIESAVGVEDTDGVARVVLTVTFSQDVAISLSADDLEVRDLEEVNTEVSYDEETRTATFTVTLPVGFEEPVTLVIPDAGLTDAGGRFLDGDADGVPGGDFVTEVPLTKVDE